jgi:hypothetical protein
VPENFRGELRWHGLRMKQKFVGFQRDAHFVRRARELKTIKAMVAMYCRGHHRSKGPGLCADCAALCDYAARRLERCVFGDAKPTCNNCVVHCYGAQMRERIRAVMRWAGPRMLLHHPLLGIAHLLDERRPVPLLPAKPPGGRRAGASEDSGPTSSGR